MYMSPLRPAAAAAVCFVAAGELEDTCSIWCYMYLESALDLKRCAQATEVTGWPLTWA